MKTLRIFSVVAILVFLITPSVSFASQLTNQQILSLIDLLQQFHVDTQTIIAVQNDLSGELNTQDTVYTVSANGSLSTSSPITDSPVPSTSYIPSPVQNVNLQVIPVPVDDVPYTNYVNPVANLVSLPLPVQSPLPAVLKVTGSITNLDAHFSSNFPLNVHDIQIIDTDQNTKWSTTYNIGANLYQEPFEASQISDTDYEYNFEWITPILQSVASTSYYGAPEYELVLNSPARQASVTSKMFSIVNNGTYWTTPVLF